MKPCIYILRSLKNGRFYIGSTNNVQRRLIEHNKGKSKYTKETGPYELIFNQSYSTLTEARKVEYWLKQQNSKDFIEKIILDGVIQKKL